MSTKYPGGILSKTAPVPTGPYANSEAPGVWTLEQQAYWVEQGNWPTAGNVNPDAFIENLFQTWLYTGNGSTQTITNGIDLAGKGGLVWLKSRSAATNHKLTDTIRGATKSLLTNNTDPEITDAAGLTAFGAAGFTLGSNTDYNNSAATYVGWSFREQAKFFDCVTYTGNGTGGRTVSHNLGSEPGFMIVKNITTAAQWLIYHRSLGNTQYLLFTTDAAGTGSFAWNNTSPTSTQFTVGTSGACNTNGDTYVAYLFAHDSGGFGLTGTDNVISCGSFTTDGSGNATVSLGYEPQYILMKKTSGVQNWVCYDTMRGWAQAQQAQLYPNITQAEDMYTGSPYFFPTATGFSLSGTFGLGNNDTFIYIAIRRGPMKVPTDGTEVFSPISTSATTGTQITTGFPVDTQMFYYPIGTNASNTTFQDRLRGVSSNSTNQYVTLVSSSTGAEGAVSGQSSLFWNNTGFQIPSYANGTSQLYLNFRRAPGFFDEVCYTGTGATATQTHNLGVVPELIIAKSRSFSAAYTDWMVYTSKNGSNKIGFLDLDAAFQATPSNVWPSDPTASVFTVGDSPTVNRSSYTYVAYLFATCPGVSKVGSYTGTGTTQTINCGFTAGARFVLIKRTDSTGDWYVWDSARGIVAGNDPYLLLNSTAAEVTGTDYVDTYSAGFEISSTAPSAINASGGTFIFLAIA